MDAEPLISVIVPAYNGEATLASTLASVAAQTYRKIEVLVVDDGSSDRTAAIAEAMAAQDSRIRLVRQSNQGVAAARNHGARLATGQAFAFVDADDLWAPEKLALQVKALHEGGPKVALVYTWSALIDADDRVYSLEHRPEFEGRVLRQLCQSNFVGNGSSTLMRREAFERTGGFDSSLHARGAQGCEDLDIYLRVAEHYEFRVVRRHLTGYRVTIGNMSSNAARMLRSCELTLARYRVSHPEYIPEIEAHERGMRYWLFVRALTTGPLSNLAVMSRRLGPDGLGALSGRARELCWLTIKARSPAWLKRPIQRALTRRAPRPLYLEAMV